MIPQPHIGLRGCKLLNVILKELGAQTDFPRRYAESQPSFQVIFPRQRLTLAANDDRIRREVEREFETPADSLLMALHELSAQSERIGDLLLSETALPAATALGRFFQRRRLLATGGPPPLFDTGATRQLIEPLQQLLSEAPRFFGHFDEAEPPLFPAGMILSRLLAGAVRVEGAGGSYLDALKTLAEQAGATIHRGALIDTIWTNGGRVTGLETAHGKLTINASHFVHALYSPELFQSMPRSKALARFQAQSATLRVRAKLFVQHFLVRAKGIAVGFADNALLLNGRRQARGASDADSSVWLTLRMEHIKDHALLSAAIPVRESEASSLPEQLGAQRQRVRKQLERVMPFLPPHIVAESSPMAPWDWDPVDPTFARKLDAWALHPFYEPFPGRLLGFVGLPFSTPYKNLYRVGREVMPGIGAVGDFASARMLAGIITKAQGKR
jgi:phytoene dehydrogenase-like protein